MEQAKLAEVLVERSCDRLLKLMTDVQKQDALVEEILWAHLGVELPLVHRLLAAGVDKDAVASEYNEDLERWTSLYAAAYRGREEIFELLLNMGANPNKVVAGDDESPLIFAITCAHNNVIEVGVAERYVCCLLDAHADVDTQSVAGNTALVYAAAHNYLDIVTILPNANADKTLVSNSGRTAL